MNEKQLIRRLCDPSVALETRKQLIDMLDAIPVAEYSLRDRWFHVYVSELPFESWDDEGFHPGRSNWPRDLQILWASTYSKSDIDNGGLHQYFGNGTGGYAPEFHEFLVRSGHADAAQILAVAMAKFGEPFPRSQSARQLLLAQQVGDRRELWDPFYKLDDQFYGCFSNGLDLPPLECENWMRKECGIQTLKRE